MNSALFAAIVAKNAVSDQPRPLAVRGTFSAEVETIIRDGGRTAPGTSPRFNTSPTTGSVMMNYRLRILDDLPEVKNSYIWDTIAICPKSIPGSDDYIKRLNGCLSWANKKLVPLTGDQYIGTVDWEYFTTAIGFDSPTHRLNKRVIIKVDCDKYDGKLVVTSIKSYFDKFLPILTSEKT